MSLVPHTRVGAHVGCVQDFFVYLVSKHKYTKLIKQNKQLFNFLNTIETFLFERIPQNEFPMRVSSFRLLPFSTLSIRIWPWNS
jgi:hypothetical protein